MRRGERRREAAGGGEVGGAGGVVGGADAQVKVDGEEEGELESVELGEGEAADAHLGKDQRREIRF